MFKWIIVFGRILYIEFGYLYLILVQSVSLLVTMLVLSITDGWSLFYNDFFWWGLQWGTRSPDWQTKCEDLHGSERTRYVLVAADCFCLAFPALNYIYDCTAVPFTLEKQLATWTKPTAFRVLTWYWCSLWPGFWNSQFTCILVILFPLTFRWCNFCFCRADLLKEEGLEDSF